jgi:hypothetical protein
MLEISPMRGHTPITWHAFMLGLASTLVVPALTAQRLQPFDSLELSFQVAVNINRQELHDYWRSYPGVSIGATTPFYYGLVQVGIQAHPFTSIDADLYDFSSVFIYLGWGIKLSLLSRISWLNMLRVGNNAMIFLDPHRENNMESELGTGMVSSLSYRFSRSWAICLAGIYNTLYTYKRINLGYLSLGMNYSFSNPEWLREFLE